MKLVESIITDEQREKMLEEAEEKRKTHQIERSFQYAAFPRKYQKVEGKHFTEKEQEKGFSCWKTLKKFFREDDINAPPGVVVAGDITRVNMFSTYFAKRLILKTPAGVSSRVYCEDYGSVGQYEYYNYYGEEYFAWDFLTKQVGVLVVTGVNFGNPHSMLEKILIPRCENRKFTILATQYTNVDKIVSDAVKSLPGVCQLVGKKYQIVDLT